MNLETEKHKLVSDIEKSWSDYKQEETKYHYMNIQTKIYEVLQKKLKEEQIYLKDPNKSLSEDIKSFSELYKTKIQNQEMMLVDLKKHQRYVKDNYDNNTLQVVLYQNLLKILDVWRKTINQTGADDEIGY